MWIEEQANGKFKYVERYTHPLTGKRKTVSITHLKKNKRIEKEMPLLLQKKIEEKLAKHSADIDFSTLTEKWLSVFKKQVKTSTLNNNQSYMIVINREIGEIALKNLQVSNVNSAILTLFDKDYGYGTVKGMVATIRNVIRFGLKYGYLVDRELLNGIHLPKINVKEKDEFKYLEREELAQVVTSLNAAGYEEIGRLCLLQTYTGMRFGELIALDYDKHINFKEKTITIERTWYHRKKIFQTPKSGKTRIIHFNKDTERLLKEQIQHVKIKTMQHGLDKNKRLLFLNYHNDPQTNSYTNELLGKYVNIPDKHVTTHIFRHTFISLMIEQGVELSLIAKHVGHSNTNMIQKVYAHFTKKMNEDLKDAVDNFSISI